MGFTVHIRSSTNRNLIHDYHSIGDTCLKEAANGQTSDLTSVALINISMELQTLNIKYLFIFSILPVWPSEH